MQRPIQPAGDDPGDASARMTAWVRGQVQGVGFRWYTRAQALAIGGLRGFARNHRDGRVEIVAEGSRDRCARLLEWLRTGDTPGRVDGVTEIWDTPRGGYADFDIR
jgi:acylphosphatase